MSKHGFTNVDIDNGQIYSRRFDDIYYSRDDGIAESRYVFLEGNGLPEAWQGRDYFCIGETGFGSGLNFLCTLEAWLADPDRSKQLAYFAIEAYPLNADALQTIYRNWPQLAHLSQALLKQYPAVASGMHSLSFEQGRVQLHLIFKPAEAALSQLNIHADCWYLDGFAPSKNPSMWQPAVLQHLAENSHANTRLATFTAAGEVRRNLISAGFDIKKCKGFGRKREMLCGHGLNINHPGRVDSRAEDKAGPSWFHIPPPKQSIQRVAVIGAGIAGAQIAFHLAQKGLSISIFEAQKVIASGASGNHAGILAPRLSAKSNLEERFYIDAFLYQLRQISLLQTNGRSIQFEQCGLLNMAHTPALKKRQQQLQDRTDLPPELFQPLNSEQLAIATGTNEQHTGWLIALAGTLSPGSLCKALLSHSSISLHPGQSVRQIKPDVDAPCLIFQNGRGEHFDAVVLANGYQVAEFSDALQIMPVRGQTSSSSLVNAQRLKHALNYEGYLLRQPCSDDKLILGASHIRGECDSSLRPEESQSNLALLKHHYASIAENMSIVKDSHAGIRASTADRLPALGALPDSGYYRQAYAALRHGEQHQRYPTARTHRGVYVLAGLGSRGLATSAYCANLLSHIINGQAPPASEHTLQALHPARFLIRALKKR